MTPAEQLGDQVLELERGHRLIDREPIDQRFRLELIYRISGPPIHSSIPAAGLLHPSFEVRANVISWAAYRLIATLGVALRCRRHIGRRPRICMQMIGYRPDQSPHLSATTAQTLARPLRPGAASIAAFRASKFVCLDIPRSRRAYPDFAHLRRGTGRSNSTSLMAIREFSIAIDKSAAVVDGHGQRMLRKSQRYPAPLSLPPRRFQA